MFGLRRNGTAVLIDKWPKNLPGFNQQETLDPPIHSFPWGYPLSDRQRVLDMVWSGLVHIARSKARSDG